MPSKFALAQKCIEDFKQRLLKELDIEMLWIERHSVVYGINQQYVKGYYNGMLQAKNVIRDMHRQVLEELMQKQEALAADDEHITITTDPQRCS